MKKTNTSSIFLLTTILLLILTLVVFCFNKEGYHPFYPHWPGYWFNYPTRHTRNMMYDIRGDPYCPNFGECGNWVRSSSDAYYGIPSFRPRFNHTKHYDVDGKLKKSNNDEIKMYPHQPWNQPTWMPHHHMMGYYAY